MYFYFYPQNKVATFCDKEPGTHFVITVHQFSPLPVRLICYVMIDYVQINGLIGDLFNTYAAIFYAYAASIDRSGNITNATM